MKTANNWLRMNTQGLIGFLLAFICIAAIAYIDLRYGHPPVATADKPFPDEETIVHISLDARINRDRKALPFSPIASDLVSGGEVYVAHCAICHGTPNRDSSFGNGSTPRRPNSGQSIPMV